MSDKYRPQSFQILPPVIKNLLIINGIFFLATISFSSAFKIDLTDILGLHYPTSEKFRVWQFLTYMFMHGSFSHIFFNMFALWMFGAPVENYWGGKKLLQFYIFCGIGAAVTHYSIFYFESQSALSVVDSYISKPDISNFENIFKALPKIPFSENMLSLADKYNALELQRNINDMKDVSLSFMHEYRTAYLNAPVIVGASGAVFGILLAFGMMFPNSMIYIYFFLPMKAKYFVILYGAIEFISGIWENPNDNVAHFAHIGGMFFGLILILFWKNRRKKNLFS